MSQERQRKKGFLYCSPRFTVDEEIKCQRSGDLDSRIMFTIRDKLKGIADDKNILVFGTVGCDQQGSKPSKFHQIQQIR